MKKNFFYAFLFMAVSGFLFACNSSSTSEQKDEHSHSESDSVLTLNNGQKWKADTITSRNVVALKTTTNMFAVEPFPSVETYQTLGNDLGNDLNKMISECKMTGDAHDALHKWLEPIIKQSNQLKSVTDTAQAKQIFASIKERVDAYPQYFDDNLE